MSVARSALNFNLARQRDYKNIPGVKMGVSLPICKFGAYHRPEQAETGCLEGQD
jgi:hypothetical protein